MTSAYLHNWIWCSIIMSVTWDVTYENGLDILRRCSDVLDVARRHQMETFSALLAICAGNSPVSGEFPAQRPVTRMFSLICAWINRWVNNGETGDLRRYGALYDVIVMVEIEKLWLLNFQFSMCAQNAWISQSNLCMRNVCMSKMGIFMILYLYNTSL